MESAVSTTSTEQIASKIHKQQQSDPSRALGLSEWQSTSNPVNMDRLCTLYALVQKYVAQGRHDAAQQLCDYETDNMRQLYVTMLNIQAFAHIGAKQNQEARDVLKDALEVQKKITSGRKNEDVMRNIQRLAGQYENAADYGNAEKMYKIIMKEQEQVSKDSASDLDLAETCNKLGNVYLKMGAYNMCEELYRRSIAIRMKVCGFDHPVVATSMSDLGKLLHKRGQLTEAQESLSTAVRIQEKTLGSNRINLSTSLNYLADLYLDQMNCTEATLLCNRARCIREQVLGGAHLCVAESLNSLGCLFLEQQRYDEADDVYIRAINILRNATGERLLGSALTLSNQANLYIRQNKLEDAERLLSRALDIRRNIFRDGGHPDIAQNMYSLSFVVDPVRGVALCEDALKMQEHFLGAVHPDVANTLCRLAELHELVSKNNTIGITTSLPKQSTFGNARTNGNSNENLSFRFGGTGQAGTVNTAFNRSPIVNPVITNGNNPIIRPAFSQHKSQTIQRSIFAPYANNNIRFGPPTNQTQSVGTNNVVNVSSKSNGASYGSIYAAPLHMVPMTPWINNFTYRIQSNNIASTSNSVNTMTSKGNDCDTATIAEANYKRAMEIRKIVFGENHIRVGDTAQCLAELYLRISKYAGSRKHFNIALNIRKATLGEPHRHIALIYDSLAKIAEATLQYDEAEQYLKCALSALPANDPLTSLYLHNLITHCVRHGKKIDADKYRRQLISL